MFLKKPGKFSDKYFLKYKTKPVRLKPYDPKQEEIGKIYLEKVGNALKDFNLKTMIRGSTAFKILGKGEVEIGIYPQKKDWEDVIDKLKTLFGDPLNREEDYVRFNDLYQTTEVEIILLKGKEGEVDIKLHEFLINHPELLKEYVQIKKKYSVSKREYQKQKHYFLTGIIKNYDL